MENKEITIGIAYDPKNSQKINDAEHLKNFLNYLFRTDKNQKWTNEMTDDDILVVGSETVEFEEQSFRQKLRDMISEVASNHLKYLYNDIAYICLPEDVEYEDAREIVAGSLLTEIISFLASSYENCYPEEKFLDTTICFVVHLDQPSEDSLNIHIHRLFVI